MEFFYELTYWVVDATGINVGAIKQWLVDHHLGPLWAIMRDLYLNPYHVAFVFPLWLVVGHFWPVDKVKQKGSYVLDFLYPLLTLPIHVLIVSYGISALQHFYNAYMPYMNTGLLNNQPIWVQALGAFLVADFCFYVFHYLSHKVPWLWHFHAIHHSQKYLNLFTHHRIHPFEDIGNAAVRIVPISIVGGSLPSIGLYVLIYNMWGYMIHANVRWNFGLLRYVLVSPQYHRMHHTIRKDQFDHNFGSTIALWDWVFGTMHKDGADYPETGVSGLDSICEKSASPRELIRAWLYQMIYPFQKIAADLRSIQFHSASK